MTMDWFPWYPTDFRRDTYHLTLAEDGAYRRLIDEYMITRDPLPNDDAALARILGIPKAEWECLAPRVRMFFRARNDKLIHKRCERELRAQVLRSSANSNRGKKAAMTRWSRVNGLDARPLLTPATLHRRKITSTEPSTARDPPESAPAAAPLGLSDGSLEETSAVKAARERIERARKQGAGR